MAWNGLVRGRGRGPGVVSRCRRYFRDTRGGAVGIPSVLVGLLCFTGTAMVSDHIVLIHQRNTLQAAAAAGGIAAMGKMPNLDESMTQDEVTAELEPLVRRYILANIPEGRRERAKETLELSLTPNRDAGTVAVLASADLGGAIVGRFIWGSLVDKVSAVSGAEQVLAPVDVVLAIDVTGSMGGSIFMAGGKGPVAEPDRRITIVRYAALTLIRGLYDQGGGTGHVSIGLVPFNTTVNIGEPRRSWVTDSESGWKTIPPGFGPWAGCIEHRRMENDLDLSLVTPDVEPFTAWFSPSTLEYRPTIRWDMEAAIGERLNGENDWSAMEPHTGYGQSPNHGCPRNAIIPLTANAPTVVQAIEDLQPWGGGGTMTHLGVVWGRRLLASTWRTAWGLPEESDDPDALPRQRVLVVLTDGINDAHDATNTYPGRYRHNGVTYNREYTSGYTGFGRTGNGTPEEGHRAGTRLTGVMSQGEARNILNSIFLDSCDRAKAEGITLFTVSAVPHRHPQELVLRDRLRECATSVDHAFTENGKPDRMMAAFREIGQMIGGIRQIRTAAMAEQ